MLYWFVRLIGWIEHHLIEHAVCFIDSLDWLDGSSPYRARSMLYWFARLIGWIITLSNTQYAYWWCFYWSLLSTYDAILPLIKSTQRCFSLRAFTVLSPLIIWPFWPPPPSSVLAPLHLFCTKFCLQRALQQFFLHNSRFQFLSAIRSSASVGAAFHTSDALHQLRSPRPDWPTPSSVHNPSVRWRPSPCHAWIYFHRWAWPRLLNYVCVYCLWPCIWRLPSCVVTTACVYTAVTLSECALPFQMKCPVYA